MQRRQAKPFRKCACVILLVTYPCDVGHPGLLQDASSSPELEHKPRTGNCCQGHGNFSNPLQVRRGHWESVSSPHLARLSQVFKV